MIRSLKNDLNYHPFEIKKGISESQWLSLKEKIGGDLIIPEDYRNFLFKYNGGSFLECYIKESPIGDLIVNECYPFDDDYSGGLSNIINHSKEDLDAGLLPIADDPGGNYYSIGVSVQNNCKIFYHLHDGVFENGKKYVKIFDSFSDFINSLEE